MLHTCSVQESIRELGLFPEIEQEPIMDVPWEVLGHVVSKVFSCRDVCDAELVLTDAIANPVEMHIDSLAALLFYGVVG